MKYLLTILLLACASIVMSQQKQITGKVLSKSDGLEMIGATVQERGTTNAVVTDMDGLFSIKVSNEKAILDFSMLGYVKKTVTVGKETQLNVQMDDDALMLDEVVAIGYGVQKKSVTTGAVSSVSTDDINKTPSMRMEQALQGRIPGVTVANESGKPGAGSTMRIRGTGTTGDNNPLFIVDGLVVGGIESISPNDIERMEVLKDAASAAIYGSRAANGVVLITTKRGKGGKTTIAYDGYYGVQTPERKVDLLNAHEYTVIQNEAFVASGLNPLFSNDQLAYFKANPKGTDWQDEILQDAMITNHQLSIIGGDDKGSYASMFSYYSQNGIVGGSKAKFDRLSLRLNADRKAKEWLMVGTNVMYTHQNSAGIEDNGEWSNAALMQALNMPPTVPVYVDGKYGQPSPSISEVVNPVGTLAISNNKWVVDRVIGNTFAEIKIPYIKGLKLRSNAAVDFSYVNGKSYLPAYHFTPVINNKLNSVTNNNSRYFTFTSESYLSYDQIFRDVHSVSGTLGTSIQHSEFASVNGTRKDLPINSLDEAVLDMGDISSQSASGTQNHNRLLSYFGRVNYAYDDKYLFSGTLRVDGSSRFGSNNRFGTFPSASVGWIFSRENFIQDLVSISFGKLRLSWGQNGNQSIGDFAYIPLVQSNNGYTLGNDQKFYSGTVPANIANADLKWETSEQTNVGVDLGFLNNRISFNADYYVKETKGLLIAPAIPGFVGNGPPMKNAGNVSNSGIELAAEYKNYDKDFKYSINVNAAHNKNEVTYIGNESKIIHGAGFGTPRKEVSRAMEGYPIAMFWGYRTDGVFQNMAEVNAHVNSKGEKLQANAQPGDVRFLNLNGDDVLSEKDQTQIGNPFPAWTFGSTINLEYKGFDLNIFIQASTDNNVYNATRRMDLPTTNYQKSILDRWTGEGTSNKTPRVAYNDVNDNYRVSDLFVEDASFLRLKSLQLGYTLPLRMTQRVGIDRLKIYTSVSNLFTLTKYTGFDPELGAKGGWALDVGIDRAAYPQARTFLMGVNMSF
ncbi:MAG: hypothetical protein RL662_1040 [Bacteroidota bacterium]|jgi:TonB-linked SusC/RagA family outer membrane protein